MCVDGVLMGVFAVLMSRGGVLLGLIVLADFVMMGCLTMMVGGGRVMGSGLIMMRDCCVCLV